MFNINIETHNKKRGKYVAEKPQKELGVVLIYDLMKLHCRHNAIEATLHNLYIINITNSNYKKEKHA